MFMFFDFLTAAGTANRGSLKYSRIAPSKFQKFQENLERLTTLSDFDEKPILLRCRSEILQRGVPPCRVAVPNANPASGSAPQELRFRWRAGDGDCQRF